MDHFAFVAEMIKYIAWPICVLVLVFLLKKPLSNLIQLIVRIKFGGFEIWFDKTLVKFKSEIPADALPAPEEKKIDENDSIKELCRQSPAQAVLESWKNIEDSIYLKLKELFPPTSTQYKRLTPQRAYTELSLTGALPPSTDKLIQELNFLRNQLVHSPESNISYDTALEYHSLTIRIRNQIESLSELPTVKLTPLTCLILEINHLIDVGKYNDISMGEIKKEIDKGTILQYLQTKVKEDIDLSIILNGTTYPGFEKFYVEELQSMCNAYSGNERRKWGIENLGLCLLLAWTNEIVQQGSGWHPSK